MSSLSRELVFLILQFLDEEKFKETVHKWDILVLFYFWDDFFFWINLCFRILVLKFAALIALFSIIGLSRNLGFSSI